MRIVYCTPGLGPCGGVRIIIEHVNRLAARGHSVFLVAPQTVAPRWIELSSDVVLVPLPYAGTAKDIDAVVATGFQTVEWALQIPARRRYYFVQMMEHEFFPANSSGANAAWVSYQLARDSGFRVVTIARWLRDTMKEHWNLDSTIVPNGVNQDHFYPDGKKQHAILVEGDARNQAKDIEGMGWRAALELREALGYKLWGYAAVDNPFVPQLDVFVTRPTTRQMREMYSQVKFLVKASRYEGRACAPVEAMCCGTPCVRAIIKGDDDLIDRVNCLRTGYKYDAFRAAAFEMGANPGLRKELTKGAVAYAREHLNWDDKIDMLEAIYEGLE